MADNRTLYVVARLAPDLKTRQEFFRNYDELGRDWWEVNKDKAAKMPPEICCAIAGFHAGAWLELVSLENISGPPAADPPHGTNARWQRGCRCHACVRAHP